jgi:hypothetical protein
MRTGAAAVLLLVSLITGAHGYTGEGILNDRVAGMQFSGRVICTRCTVAEARKTLLDKWDNHLYRITRGQEQAVIEIEWISNPWRWNRLVTTPHLQLRGADSLFQQLTTVASRGKKVEVSGMLSSTQTLDMHKVTILE